MNELVKVVIWDLDNTIWQGVAAEDDAVAVRPGCPELLAQLDASGVVQSVASRGDHGIAVRQLAATGLAGWFVFPQIAWCDKSESVRRIAGELNLRLENIVLVDDDPYERAEVAAALPDVRTFPADFDLLRTELLPLVDRPEGGPAPSRRELYQVEQRRQAEEAGSGLSREEFLAGLGLTVGVRDAVAGDLPRLAELTRRTSQLNTTGLVISQDELAGLLSDPGHRVVAAEMADRFGSYGTVGLCVLRVTPGRWRISLLLTSCRVASRGGGSLLLRVLLGRANTQGIVVDCDLVANGRNHPIQAALRFAGLRPAQPCDQHANCTIYRFPRGSAPPPLPEHVTLHAS